MEKDSDDFNFRDLFLPLTTKKIILIFIVIGFIVFLPTLFNGYVADDYYLLVNNPLVHSLKNFARFFIGSFGSLGGSLTGVYYRPVMSLHFAIIHAFFGINPFFYHLSQLLFHIANAFLIFKFMKFFLKKYTSFFLALIFLIHPINVEAVTYVAASQEVLFVFFGFCALIVAQNKKITWTHYLAIFCSLLLSILSKESGVLFIGILLLFSAFFKKSEFKWHALLSILCFLTYIFLRIGIAHLSFGHIPPNPISELTLQQRMINVPAIIAYYFTNFVYPMNLVMPQGWIIKSINFENFYLPLFIELGVAGVIIFGGFKLLITKYIKIYLVFLAFLVLGLLLHIQIVPLDLTASDRWFYFPIIGLLGILGVVYQYKNKIFDRRFLLIILLLVMLLLSIRSFIRVSQWKDGLTLWSNDIKISKDNSELDNAYGFALIGAQRYRLAEVHLNKSINLYPNGSNWTNLGVVYSKLGDPKSAVTAFRNGVMFNNYYLAFENLAIQLGQLNAPDAKSFTLKALAKYPYSSRLWLALAITEYRNGDKKEALKDAEKSVRMDPSREGLQFYIQIKQELASDK